MATGRAGHFVAMACNNAWANHRLLGACTALTADEFGAPRVGFFPSLRATLNHILWVDAYYVDALERDPTVLARYDDPPPDFAEAAALRDAQRASDRRLIAFCERQTEDSLDEGLVLPRPNRTPPPTSVASILMHLFQHQTHHRGQAHAMLAGTPVKPPQLDEFFLAGEQHLRRDELIALGLPPT
ncbi:MAG: DinB family protein [Enhydrobacter sp.]|nr:MAG: DinB family protein [Enhydrobacter sp.]